MALINLCTFCRLTTGARSRQKMFGWDGELSPQQTAEIAAAKRVIYDAFRQPVAGGVPKEKAGILVDEQFGAAILRDAARQGYTTACPAEKSGQDEFDFEYGDDFGKHIEAFHPTFCKVLVRYNPEGDQSLNQRQSARLKRLSDYLHSDRVAAGSCSNCWSRRKRPSSISSKETRRPTTWKLRPRLMAQTIEQLQDARVEPDVWKIEGLDRHEDCEKIVAAARRGGRDRVGCIILGRGEDDRKVREWLDRGRGVPGLHRLRRRPDQLLGSAGRLAREEDNAEGRSSRDCPPLPGVRGNLRGPQEDRYRLRKRKRRGDDLNH